MPLETMSKAKAEAVLEIDRWACGGRGCDRYYTGETTPEGWVQVLAFRDREPVGNLRLGEIREWSVDVGVCPSCAANFLTWFNPAVVTK